MMNDTLRPSRRGRSDQLPHRQGRVHHTETPGRVVLLGDEREQSEGEREEHRQRVANVGSQNVSPGAHVAKCLSQLFQGMSVILTNVGHAVQPEDQRRAHDERHQVEQIRRLHAAQRDEKAADGRPDHARRASPERVQCSGGGHLVGGHHPWHDALEARALQAVDRRDENGDDVDRPHLGAVTPPRVEQQHHHPEHERRLGEEHHRSAVETIRQHATPQAEHDQRQDLEETEHAHRHVRTGDVGHLIRHGDEGRRRPETGDQTRPEKQSILAILAQRGQIHITILTRWKKPVAHVGPFSTARPSRHRPVRKPRKTARFRPDPTREK